MSDSVTISALEKAYTSLFNYCRAKDFRGFDPFDGLRSPLFKLLPFGSSKFVRLGFQQVIKRSGYDLRPALRIKPGENAKALALFALAETARYRTTGDEKHRRNASELIDRLDQHEIRDGDTLAFGYNFDWQSRAFFAPRGTPTIVPTAFAARAMLEYSDAFADEALVRKSEAICRFIVTKLKRIVDTDDELALSYKPDDDNIIYNASLLGAETLAEVGRITNNDRYIDLASRAATFVVNRQQQDGSWRYGEKAGWIDNFHTAYILESLYRIDPVANANAIRKGFDFWLNNLFLDDGTPRYFHDNTYPIDTHSSAAAIVTLSQLSDHDPRTVPLAEKIAAWTLGNMRDPRGFFYYQMRKSAIVKTDFIRWSQAWMAYALSRLIETKPEAG